MATERLYPHPSIIRGLRADRVDYKLLIAEAIDNSLDAGASTVIVSWGKDEVSIRDNGCGVLRSTVDAMRRIGEHGELPTTRLGRFGVGLKFQSMAAGAAFHVLSQSRDGRVNFTVDWDQMMALGEWEYEKPEWLPVSKHSANTGTHIRIVRLRRRLPTAAYTERIAEEIAAIFYPALMSGRTLTLQGDAIRPQVDPPLEDIRDATVWLRAGKGATIHAGYLA